MIETSTEIRKKLFYYKNQKISFYFDPELYSKLSKNINIIPLDDYKYLGKKIESVNLAQESIIKKAFKIWDIGWYISITFFLKKEINIPWENISSKNPIITESINISHLQFKIKES
jgi:hypothetical protein